MMIKVNGEFLDFSGYIEIEKKIKLFEEIETTDGDFSFAFDLPLTSNNIRVLNKPFPDSSSKTVYTINDTEILSDEGLLINRGYLRIERVVGYIASCSFFGGNNNWFAMLSGSMLDLDLSKYDVSLNADNVNASWSATEGIMFPLIDTGALITRAYKTVFTEDFVGCFFAHTLLKEVFIQSGIKIQGELLDDPFFRRLVVAANGRSTDQINNRKSYVKKDTVQVAPNISDPQDVITFDDDSVLPYFDGSQDNFDLANNRYVADIKMNVSVSYTFNFDAIGLLEFVVFKNGVGVHYDLGSASVGTITNSYIFNLEAGDYIDFRFREFVLSSGEITNGTVTITPIFLYETYGVSALPNWTKQQYVSNILSLFNTVCAYDSFTKTLTINLFNKVNEKTPIDISEFIESVEVDYSEMISNYGKATEFEYQEGNDVDLEDYNISDYLKSVKGEIEVNNDFIADRETALESDFSSPVSYKNAALNCSLERIHFIELVEGLSGEITSVSDASGVPRFNISDADQIFVDAGLVRIETNVPEYNGDFRIETVASSYITVLSLEYISDAVGDATMMSHSITSDDNVYLFAVTTDEFVTGIMDMDNFFLDEFSQASVSLAYFNLLRLGRAIEDEYKQGLSFSSIDNMLFFQRTMIENYWSQFARILNDPVKLLTIGHLPWKVYNAIDFLRPVEIKSIETSNRYYVNLISGYKNSHLPCEIELIKLP